MAREIGPDGAPCYSCANQEHISFVGMYYLAQNGLKLSEPKTALLILQHHVINFFSHLITQCHQAYALTRIYHSTLVRETLACYMLEEKLAIAIWEYITLKDPTKGQQKFLRYWSMPCFYGLKALMYYTPRQRNHGDPFVKLGEDLGHPLLSFEDFQASFNKCGSQNMSAATVYPVDD